MNFTDAILALKQHKTVTRASWPESKGYLVFLPGMSSVWCITSLPTVNAGNNLFSVDDFMAEDWQVSDGANKSINLEDGA